MPRTLVARLLLVVAAGPSAPPLTAQSAAPLSFEVASIKRNASLDGFSMLGAIQPGGRFTMTNVTVRDMVGLAFQLRDFQIEGGPDWTRMDRYDIVAKAAGPLAPPSPPWVEPTSTPPALLMLQSLLGERFKLAVYHESREGAIYALVMSRSDRKPGPQLKPSDVDCAALRAARGRVAVAGPPPPPPPPPQPGQPPPPCVMGGGRGGYLFGGAMPLASLVLTLSRIVDRPVIDRTNLTGNFDFTLAYTPDQLPAAVPGASGVGPPPPPLDGPSLMTALQEQLGLKLESERGAIQFIVIDHVERPTEN